MSTKVIDIYNNLNFVSNYNANGISTGSDLVTISQYGILTLNSTQSSLDQNTGSLVIPNGSIAIGSNVNATGVAQGGSLTVGGGGAFSQDVYIGGNLNISGAIISTSSVQGSNSFNYLSLTATDYSLNLSTGSLVTFGGISIQAIGNATSSTSGGGITIAGGASIKKDLYIGGKANLPNIISINITSSNAVFGNITTSTLNINAATIGSSLITTSTITNLLVINSLNAAFNSNTIGSIFTTGGNVGINTTTPGYVLDISGNLRVSSSSLNIISANTLNDVLQIQNTSASGASTLQFLNNTGSSKASFGIGNSNNNQFQNTVYLSTISGVPINLSAGGNTNTPIIINASDNSMSITSTTTTNSVSSGALKVSGGAGISGSLYVGGGLFINSQIAATITNTTVSINSTTGAVLLSGGLSINILNTNNANATSYTSGGALTINGGAAISQNVYISGILDIASGSNNMNSINLQSIQLYSNSNNGGYSVIGSGNSNRTASSFTPIRFTGWNDQSNPKLTINTNTIDIINAVNATNNSNTLGNIFTTNGNVGVGTTQPNFNLDVTGNINFSGALYKNSTLYVSSQWIGTNGTLLTYGSTGSGALVGINTTNPTFSLDVAGTSRISVSLTTGSIYSTNQTTTNIVSSNISAGTLNAGTGIFTNLVVLTNSSLGTINSIGLTTGNINFTGNLYQNGTPYFGSQWTTTSGSTITYTSGNVLVSNLISTSNLQTINLTAGTLNVINGLTTSNINFTGTLSQNGVSYLGSQWTGTSGSLLYYGTTSNIFVGIGTSNPNYTLTVNGIIGASGLSISGTTNSLNSTTGQYIFNSLSLSTTQDVSSFTQGGSLTIGGGAAFGKSIAIAGGINYSGVATDIAGSFNANNNVSIPANITGLLFPTANIRSFTLTISIQILATNSLYAQYIIEGIQNASGWFIDDSYVGDNTGILFSITNTGQIVYTSTNVSSWSSTTFNYRSTSYSISANYIQTAPPTSGNYTVTGNLAVLSTTDALSSSQGSIITNGGIFVAKSINVGTGIVNNNVSVTSSGTFSGINGQSTPANITGLILASASFNSFSIIMNVILLRSSGGNFRAQYTLEGIQKDTGWFIYVTSLGDTIDLIFNITSTGQLQYSSTTTYSNFTSITFNYNLTAFYVTGGFNPLNLPGASNSVSTLSISSIQDVTNSTTAALIVAGGAAINLNLLVGAGITAGNINSNGLTTGNINFTGGLYQNGTPYVGSQWTTTSGNLSYTSGNVIVSGNISSSGLITTNATINNLLIISTNGVTSNSSGLQIFGGATIAKDLLINGTSYFTTSGNLGINTTTPTFALDVNGTSRISTSITTGSIYSTNITTTNLVSTNTSLSNLISSTSTFGILYSGSQTTGTILVTTSANLSGNTNTIGNLFTTGGNVGINTTSPGFTLDISGSTRITGGLTTGTLTAVVGANISNLLSSSITTSSLNTTNISTTNIISTNNTINNLNTVNISSSSLFSSNITSTNLFSTNTSLSNLISLTSTFSSLYSGSQTVGTILVTTSANLSGNTNTIGNLFTTGGNVGINTTSPGFTLDVLGIARITTSITTGSIYSTNITSTNLVGTNITTSALISSLITVNSLLATSNVSTSNVFSTNITATNLVSTVASTGTLNIVNFIMGNSKKYIYSGSIPNTTNGNLILSFNTLNSYLYAKVSVALQETSNLQNISILQFECSAAGSTTSGNPNFWNLGVNGSTSYPWTTSITTGSNSTAATLQFAPVTSLRNYNYTIQIDMTGTAKASTLIQDNTIVNTWNY